MPALKTQHQFIDDARSVHGDRYNYSQVRYMQGRGHVTIVCSVHGPFQQAPMNHLQGKGCRQCPYKNSIGQKEFLCRANETHGDKYAYNQTVYRGENKSITVMCKTHGLFTSTPKMHCNGTGCRQCFYSGRTLTMGRWLQIARQRHGDRYNYDSVVYISSRTPVTIECKVHGTFQQVSNEHLQGGGCPRCVHKVSKPSLEWLHVIARLDQTHIQHGGTGGEVRLAGTRWHADGFSADLNKVYEFLGDYYHGNPRRYDADVANKKCKRTMGELYENTCKRRKVIEDLGYAYEEIWEDEFDAAKTLLTLCDVRA